MTKNKWLEDCVALQEREGEARSTWLNRTPVLLVQLPGKGQGFFKQLLIMVFLMVLTLPTTEKTAPIQDFRGLFAIEWEKIGGLSDTL